MSTITYQGPNVGSREWYRYWERKRKDELVRELTTQWEDAWKLRDEIARLTAEAMELRAQADRDAKRADCNARELGELRHSVRWLDKTLDLGLGTTTEDRSWTEMPENVKKVLACAVDVNTLSGAMTMAEGQDANTPSCEKERRPGSASDTEPSEQRTQEQAGPTTTKQDALGGSQNKVYVVLAHRGGDYENHTYAAAVCESEAQARVAAEDCEQYRGGKYACSVWCFRVGPFDGDADPEEVVEARHIPGWKTALQRLIDDKRRDELIEQLQAEVAERDRVIDVLRDNARDQGQYVSAKLDDLQTARAQLSDLRAAVRWLFDTEGAVDWFGNMERSAWFGRDSVEWPQQHADALRMAMKEEAKP